MDRFYVSPALYIERGSRVGVRKFARGDRGDRWYVRGSMAPAGGRGFKSRKGALRVARAALYGDNPPACLVCAGESEEEE